MNYFDWLLLIVAPNYDQRANHIKLLIALYSTEFHWVVKRDQNRARDGMDLRSDYRQDTGLYPELYGPCTCLEMFVAMAIRCENELMYKYDPDAGDQTDHWFWMMINNLGLDYYDDSHFNERAVNNILERFMSRKYGPDLAFCPFPVENFVPDFEQMELAYQMNFYIRENFY